MPTNTTPRPKQSPLAEAVRAFNEALAADPRIEHGSFNRGEGVHSITVTADEFVVPVARDLGITAEPLWRDNGRNRWLRCGEECSGPTVYGPHHPAAASDEVRP